MSEMKQYSYPTVAQSIGIVGIVILSMIVFLPITLFELIKGKEIATFIYYLFALGAPLLIIHNARTKRTGQSSYNLKISNFRVILLLSLIAISIDIGVTIPVTNIIPMPDMWEKIILELSEKTGIFSFLMIVIAAPILEEFIFRGVILDGFLRNYSPFKSILMSSLLFGIIHLNPWQFIAATITGFFSGWVYYRTRKLTLSIIIHFVNNLFAFIMMKFTDPQEMIDSTLLEFYGGMIGLVLSIVGGIIIATCCIYLLNKELNKVQSN